MTTFYVGVRPVLKGRSLANTVNTYTGKAMKYSNWLLMSPDHVLDGAPDHQFIVGKHNGISRSRLLAQLFAGTVFYTSPMDGAGLGNRQINGRYRPLEFKGLSGAAAFPTGYGHLPLRGLYYSETNAFFHGVPSSPALPTSAGHVRRFNTTYGGAFDPYAYKGVTLQAINNPGSPLPATATTDPYGHNKVNEWRGVPSSKAL